ncbi:hypothetical protein V8B97DRAFT_1874519 [Scleroderma yunnanense]
MTPPDHLTTPSSVQHNLHKFIGSSLLSIQPSSPLSTVASSSPGGFSGCRDTSHTTSPSKVAMQDILWISRNACHKFLPYARPNVMEALELWFTGRSLRGGAGVNIGCHDAKRGRHLFLNNIKHLSDNALQEALLMKHAGHETRHYQALASAWELKEVEHYGKLMVHMHKESSKEYEEYMEYMKEELAKDKDDVDSLIALNHETYNEELMSFSNANTQLDHLEEEMHLCIASNYPFPLHDSDDSLNLDSELDDGEDGLEAGNNKHGDKDD